MVVATNKDGSVNGKTFMVSGILESATGPGGRDGYIHIDDAMEILRMPEMEVSEIAVRVQDLGQVSASPRASEPSWRLTHQGQASGRSRCIPGTSSRRLPTSRR